MFRLEPMNQAARDFEQTVYAAREEHGRRQREAMRVQGLSISGLASRAAA